MKSRLARLIASLALIAGILLMTLSTLWTSLGRENFLKPTEVESYNDAVGKMHSMNTTKEEYSAAKKVADEMKLRRDQLFVLKEQQAVQFRRWGIGCAIVGAMVYYFFRGREEDLNAALEPHPSNA